jgi:tetratricopeptide (TPR) repeat protein
LDEGSARAHALLAQVLVDRIYLGWSRDRTAELERAERHLARALAIDDRNILAHYKRGGAQALRWRFDEAIVEFDTVIALSPNLPDAYGSRGATKVLMDKPAEAIADLTEAMRISPRDRTLGFWFHCLGQASLMLGRDEEALGHFMHSAVLSPSVPAYQLFLGAAYGLAGRKDEARAALRELRERYPQTTIANLRPNWTAYSPCPLWRAMRERLLEGLRLAGVPDE